MHEAPTTLATASLGAAGCIMEQRREQGTEALTALPVALISLARVDLKDGDPVVE